MWRWARRRGCAVMGIDYHKHDAEDLFVLMRSFLDAESKVAVRDSAIRRARVFPSAFGLERLAQEEVSGPAIAYEGSDDEDPAHDEAVRKYQKERLKYYFGVVDCESLEAATFLYDELDGMTVEHLTPHALELRFVPEDLEFPNAPKSSCSTMPKTYAAPETDKANALTHSKVSCTWDEPMDKRRVKKMTKRYSEKELAEMDLNAYLGSSSSDELDEDNVADYRKLLLGDAADADSDDEVGPDTRAEPEEMEISFQPAVSALAEQVEQKARDLPVPAGSGRRGLAWPPRRTPGRRIWRSERRRRPSARRSYARSACLCARSRMPKRCIRRASGRVASSAWTSKRPRPRPATKRTKRVSSSIRRTSDTST